jgi:hypothetical protein
MAMPEISAIAVDSMVRFIIFLLGVNARFEDCPLLLYPDIDPSQ